MDPRHGKERIADSMKMDINATIQAAAVLLGEEPSERMSYIRLLKLLYLADREMFRQTGRPITFDRVVAMKHGPVLSNTYNLIKGEDVAADRWAAFIDTDRYHAVLRENPGRGDLSRRAVAILHQVHRDHSHLDDWKLIEKLHEELDEWRENPPPEGGSRPIPINAILDAVGFDEEQSKAVIEDLHKRVASPRPVA